MVPNRATHHICLDFWDGVVLFTIYCFLKMYKQYVFNNKTPHYFCLCEFCEHASLLAKRKENICRQNLNLWLKHNYCNDTDRDCMMSHRHKCNSHSLAEIDCKAKNNASSDTSVKESKSEPNFTIKFYHWHKSKSGHLA